MADMLKKDRSRTGIDNRCRYAANGGKGNQNVLHIPSIHKGKHEVHERLS